MGFDRKILQERGRAMRSDPLSGLGWSEKTISRAIRVADLVIRSGTKAQVVLRSPAKRCERCGLRAEIFVEPPGTCSNCWSAKWRLDPAEADKLAEKFANFKKGYKPPECKELSRKVAVAKLQVLDSLATNKESQTVPVEVDDADDGVSEITMIFNGVWLRQLS
jgi:hypothetical protein